ELCAALTRLASQVPAVDTVLPELSLVGPFQGAAMPGSLDWLMQVNGQAEEFSTFKGDLQQYLSAAGLEQDFERESKLLNANYVPQKTDSQKKPDQQEAQQQPPSA